MLSLRYCLHTSSICFLVYLLVNYGNFSIERRIDRYGANERRSASLRQALISTVLIRGWLLFEAQCLLDEIRYSFLYPFNVNSHYYELL